MRVFRSLPELTGRQPSVVTIGNFDGVHRGHRTVIDNVIACARALDAQSIAVTFDPHPIRVLHPDVEVRLITPLAQKLELLAATGLDAALVLPFTPEFSQWSARDFASRVLRDTLHATEVHEGENFRFGHDAAEDVAGLTHLGEELGFAVRAYHPQDFRGSPVSSTRVRKLIAAGDVHHARALLQRPFAIRSTPASGRGYGTRYAVPTINLASYSDLLPANGVYITTLKVGANPAENRGADPGAPSSPGVSSPAEVGQPQNLVAPPRLLHSVTNCGNRPTFGADSFAVESYCLDFELVDLTESTPLELTFLHRLRGEVRFPSPEALRTQITHDVSRAERYFQLCRSVARALPRHV